MSHRSPTRYSATAQGIHWLTAILVLLAFVYGPGGTEQRVYSSARDFDRQLHETLGVAVLVLPRFALFASPRRAMYRNAGAWLEGHALTLLGGVLLSPWFPESHALGAKVAEVHTWLGDSLIWLAGAHALAGLAHHYVLKDHVLRTMLPRRVMR